MSVSPQSPIVHPGPAATSERRNERVMELIRGDRGRPDDADEFDHSDSTDTDSTDTDSKERP